jgi:type IV pilus assembly protein PilV
MYRPSLLRSRGFTLIEILVTLVVTAVGLLGMAGFIVRASTLSSDAVQRARATVLLQDMAHRISNNKAAALAGSFVTGQVYGASESATPCIDEPDAARQQLCEWNNLLAGANDGGRGAAFLGYRGCVTRGPTPADPLFIVTVTWGSLTTSAPPADLCGSGVFGDESLRRVLRMQVRIAQLKA